MDEEQLGSYYDDQAVWADLAPDELLLTEMPMLFPDAPSSDPAVIETDGSIVPPRIVCYGLHAFNTLPEIHRQVPEL